MKITDKEIFLINKLYNEIGTYSGVAKEIGCAPTTVKKYIIPNFDPNAESKKVTFTLNDLSELSIDHIKDLENICNVCHMTTEQMKLMNELRKEIVI